SDVCSSDLSKFLTVLMLFCFVAPTHGQFLKKLKKKAGDAVEQTVLNRTEKEVSKATDDAIDDMIESSANEKHATNDSKEMQESIRSEEHTSELQSRENPVCRLLLEKTTTIVM